MKKTGRGYVFVYGSLKVGGHFSKAFDGRRLSVGPASVKGTLYDLRNFPGLVMPGDYEVYGELHLYKDIKDVVEEMNYIEGFRKRNDPRNLYNRSVIDVTRKDGSKVRALVYTLNTDRINIEGCGIVEDGVWPIT